LRFLTRNKRLDFEVLAIFRSDFPRILPEFFQPKFGGNRTHLRTLIGERLLPY
jgi:hypothetical protein